MQSNLSVNSLSFGANVSRKFQDAAYYYYTRTSRTPNKLQDFAAKVNDFADFGYNNMTISYKKKSVDGKLQHILYASEPGYEDEAVILTKKDMFRKVLEKFMHINKHEFETKIRGNK